MPDRSLPHLIVFGIAWSLALSIFAVLSYNLFFPLIVRNLLFMAVAGGILAIGMLWASRQLGRCP